MSPNLALALLVLSLYCLVGAEILIALRKIPQLSDVPERTKSRLPKVSIIMPALNEGDTIGPSLESVFSLRYPELEVIVVDDRSTDHTLSVLERIAENNPGLNIVRITELPPGWIGKNHALYRGTHEATGELFLFTDADVIFEASSLMRAVCYLENAGLDHLAVACEIVPHDGLYNMVSIEGAAALIFLAKPWRASEPGAENSVGVGAFNLVSRDAYMKCGTHRSISGHVIDDLSLGRLIKSHGFKQELLMGRSMIMVDWYPSLSDMIQGLQKNVFAVLNFSLIQAVLASLAYFVIVVWPLYGALTASGMTSTIYWAAVSLRFAIFTGFFFSLGIGKAGLLWYPVAPFVVLFVLWKSVIGTIINRGISWRGTFYPLRELRKVRQSPM